QVVQLPDCERVLESVASRTGGFVTVDMLEAPTREYIDSGGQRSKFGRLLVTGVYALDLVGLSMAPYQELHLGLAGAAITKGHLDILAEVFGPDAAASQALPSVTVITSIGKNWEGERFGRLHQLVISPLQRRLSAARSVLVLNEIASSHERAADLLQRQLLEVFILYLKDARELPEFSRTVLAQIR